MIANKNDIGKHDLYLNAYIRTLRGFLNNACYDLKEEAKRSLDNRDTIKRIVFYGVKVVNTEDDSDYMSKEEFDVRFSFASSVKELMSLLTPKEFMQLYPIEKEYQGHKWGAKDYFYTRDYINTLEQDKPIDAEILEFLYEYHNWEIFEFVMKTIEYMDGIRKFEGRQSMISEFMAEQGITGYEMHTDHQGNKFIIKEGKPVKFQSSKPKHLRLIK